MSIKMLHTFEINGQDVLDIIYKCHQIIFILVFVAAMAGKKIGIRKGYIRLLDKLFQFAAAKMEDKLNEEGKHDEERIKETMNLDSGESKIEDQEGENRVVISPQRPRVHKDFLIGRPFHFNDLTPYMTAGVGAILEDGVSSSFSPEELKTWNMLSRTKTRKTTNQSKSVTTLWLLGFLFRYIFLVPVRIAIFIITFSNLIICTFLVGFLPDGKIKRKMNAFFICWCFDAVANTLSVFARFHDKQYRPTHGIAVANHTSPIDSMLLSTDNCYDMVGQKTKGILGLFMSALSRSSSHIWFDRSNAKDRGAVTKLMQDHAEKRHLPPILIFPEGICVNNTAVLQFRKGVFEMDTVIHPIAVKFDARYGDAFWWQNHFFYYIIYMMSSWAIVCNIWYLPPMKREAHEPPSQFADRVKKVIAQKIGLKELEWDGTIKTLQTSSKAIKEDQWRQKQQQEFAQRLLEKYKNIS